MQLHNNSFCLFLLVQSSGHAIKKAQQRVIIVTPSPSEILQPTDDKYLITSKTVYIHRGGASDRSERWCWRRHGDRGA